METLEGADALSDGKCTAADLVSGPPLVAHGSGWDASGAWRHAGMPTFGNRMLSATSAALRSGCVSLFAHWLYSSSVSSTAQTESSPKALAVACSPLWPVG